MAVSLINALLVVCLLVVPFVTCVGRNGRLQLQNSRARSAVAVRSNPTLDIRVMHYYYDGDCDPWITIIAAKCEPRFTITYSWINTAGVTQTRSQTHNGGDDVAEVNFPASIRLTEPAQSGSTATVLIAVVDEDVSSDDLIGNFFFDFDIPEEPGNYIPTTVTKHLANGAQMSVEFSVRY
ncbi:uncharacterized protein LOC129591501 [Paramacrobiotus metropolitanus]|uniref:uncharacterized protein LOC129591501 n=1 Tax=Paramacrobiotus metropolitanus TaxID=2943436 RepID=UPI00244607A2|nr:uncharacterized protein LOC129591501 [Paramacrobiotus metropolitanus]